MTPQQRLKYVYTEGRLIRRQWSATDEQGRQLLCLYTALAGDAKARPASCPAELSPRWIAHLLPWLDDAPSEEAWPGIVKRVIAVTPRLPDVSPECEWRVRALCVREAMRHTDNAEVLTVCEQVAGLCERRGHGEVVSDKEMEAAWAAEAAEATSDRLADAILTEIERDLAAA